MEFCDINRQNYFWEKSVKVLFIPIFAPLRILKNKRQFLKKQQRKNLKTRINFNGNINKQIDASLKSLKRSNILTKF